MDRIRVLLVEHDDEARAALAEALGNVEYIVLSGEAKTTEQGLAFLEGTPVDVALVNAHVPGDGYKLAEKLAVDYPGLAVILIEQELREETMRKAIFAGAKDILLSPFTPAKLVDSIYRSFQTEKKKQLIQRDNLPKLRRKTHQGKVITVFSTKGGVGKTFVSTNLAVSLALQTEAKVVLLDLDLDFGNAALALNIVPRFTISDVINELRNLDQELMESYLIPHRSGIKLLAANAQPQMSDFINGEQIEMIIKALQAAYDYVVIDMPARFYDPVDPAFQEADQLLLITAQDVATLKNIKSGLATLSALNYPRSKIRVLLNRAEGGSEIKPRDVEATLNTELYAVLPADYKLVSASLNKGIPVVILYPKAKISRAFQELARRVVGEDKES